MLRSLLLLVTLGSVALGAQSPPSEPVTTPSPVVVETPLTPEAMYIRAIRAMRDEPIPPYITLTESGTARNLRFGCTSDGTSMTLKHGDDAVTYNVWFRTSDAQGVVEDVRTHKRCNGAILEPAGRAIASLGTVTPFPNATDAPTPAATTSGNEGSSLIGSVRAVAARYYHVTLVGDEEFEGHPVHHLKLQAYRDRLAHPLTDLLVDTSSYLVREVRGDAAVHFLIGSGRAAGVLQFDRIGGFWVVTNERLEFAANALFLHARGSIVVRGSNYAYPDALPTISFPTPSPSAVPRMKR